MSDLLVTYEGLSLPPKACSEEPPPELAPLAPGSLQPKMPGKGQSVTIANVDGCSVVFPLVPSDQPDSSPRYVRFDRQKDRFVLSSTNSADNLTWVGKQKNLGEILDVARVLEKTLRQTAVADVNIYAMKLSIIQFLITGQVNLHGSEEKSVKRPRTEVDLAERTLEIFSITSDQGIANFIGPINVFRADTGISEAAKKRITFLNQILDLRPKYRSLRNNFADPLMLDRWLEMKGEERSRYKNLLTFIRQTVVNESLGQPLRYDEAFAASFKAFLELHPDMKEEAGKDAYCQALEAGLREMRGGKALAPELIAECRAAMDWSTLAEDEALRKSLRFAFLSEGAKPLLEQAISAESRQADMKVDWLADRGRFAEAYKLLDGQLKITLPKGEGAPTLSIDPAALRVQLNVWVSTHLTQRRERLLASLALLRRTFGESGTPATVRVFHRGRFVQAEWKLDAAALTQIRDFQAELKRDINVSQTRSEVWLPIVEGATCAAGVAGLGFSEGFGGLDSRPDLKLGFGATSAGLAGAGCSSLIGHYLLPKVGKVRNRYLWEGVTGVAGAALGVGIYFLARSFSGDRGNRTKFPVDEYGP